MARIRPAKGQGKSGDGAPPGSGGTRPSRGRRTPPSSPRPAPQGRRGRQEAKAGSVTKAVAQQRRGSRFLSEVVAELRKVSWPDRAQLLQSTAVVLVVVALVAAYLAVLDEAFGRVIDALF